MYSLIPIPPFCMEIEHVSGNETNLTAFQSQNGGLELTIWHPLPQAKLER